VYVNYRGACIKFDQTHENEVRKNPIIIIIIIIISSSSSSSILVITFVHGIEPSGSYPGPPKTGWEGDLDLVLFRGLALISPIRCLSDRSPGKRPLKVCINKHDPQAQYIHIHAYIEVTI
jgi:hypothetical protein